MPKPYTYKWEQYRKCFLLDHPYCSTCGAKATIIDHIQPHKGDMVLFWDQENHQPLCKKCHDKKTYHKDGGLPNRRKRKENACGLDGLPIDPEHHWNKKGEKQ